MEDFMNTVEHGLRNYRTHDVHVKREPSAHPLDILSSILFEIKAENRHQDNDLSSPSTRRNKTQQEDFQKILKKEMTK